FLLNVRYATFSKHCPALNLHCPVLPRSVTCTTINEVLVDEYATLGRVACLDRDVRSAASRPIPKARASAPLPCDRLRDQRNHRIGNNDETRGCGGRYQCSAAWHKDPGHQRRTALRNLYGHRYRQQGPRSPYRHLS